MYIKKTFKEFINESGIGGVNVGGVNFGSSGTDVGKSNFGKKGDSSFDKRGQMNPIDGTGIYSEVKDVYLSSGEVKDLLRRYDIWCKQNGGGSIPITNIDTKNIDYIIDKLNQ